MEDYLFIFFVWIYKFIVHRSNFLWFSLFYWNISLNLSNIINSISLAIIRDGLAGIRYHRNIRTYMLYRIINFNFIFIWNTCYLFQYEILPFPFDFCDRRGKKGHGITFHVDDGQNSHLIIIEFEFRRTDAIIFSAVGEESPLIDAKWEKKRFLSAREWLTIVITIRNGCSDDFVGG